MVPERTTVYRDDTYKNSKFYSPEGEERLPESDPIETLGTYDLTPMLAEAEIPELRGLSLSVSVPGEAEKQTVAINALLNAIGVSRDVLEEKDAQ